MSEPTEFCFEAKLSKSLPPPVLAILQYMVEAEEGAQLPPLPESGEALFATKGWATMLRRDDAGLSYRRSSLRFDQSHAAYILCVQCSLRDEESVIEKFVDWIVPHLDEPESKRLGFYRRLPSWWSAPVHMPGREAWGFAEKNAPPLSGIRHDLDKVDQAALALLYLGKHEYYSTWKGLDWSVMGRLHERGFIGDPVGKQKSVGFTDAGLREAVRLFRVLFAAE